ncbi:MAG: radical SAM protein [Oscillospiraceae bacterium]|nr:radical SAM protein [Oscillospiraceae bacterium]
MTVCNQCPRGCGVPRDIAAGYCGEQSIIRIARAAPHMWEEPPISGKNGSGTIFFSGCSLRCVYCQNYRVAESEIGTPVTPEQLVRIMFDLRDQGVHNINLVTPSHFTAELVPVLDAAKRQGIGIPLLWNSSGYERPETLRLLDGLIDIYLPDFKYLNPQTAAQYSHAPDYPEVAKAALAEMVRQRGAQVFDADGMLLSGVQVRHLVLPGHTQESRQILWYLRRTYGSTIGVSVMNQYTPMPQVMRDPLLSRRVTEREYQTVLHYAELIGMEQILTQSGEAADESFIPAFGMEL